jgi:C4-type Zn-finger protein
MTFEVDKENLSSSTKVRLLNKKEFTFDKQTALAEAMLKSIEDANQKTIDYLRSQKSSISIPELFHDINASRTSEME